MADHFNPFSLEGKTILVTGASSGIGRAVAVNCSKMGADVIITGRNVQRLASTLDSLEKGNHQMISADLTDNDDIARLAKEAPLLDGIVHCAGIGHRMPCKAISESDIDKVMKANFSSAVLLQSALLSSRKIRNQASIVFLSSRTSEIPTIANSIYSASKGAIASYAKCLSLELASRQIRVNCISPSMVWTDLIMADGVEKEDLHAKELEYPLKRYGQPEDIAYLAIYLLSGASSWMTGSNIDITGGSTII